MEDEEKEALMVVFGLLLSENHQKSYTYKIFILKKLPINNRIPA